MAINFVKTIRLSCLLLPALFVAGCGKSADSSTATAQEGVKQPLKVVFQLDWYPAPEHGGEYQALVKNFYRDEGLDLSIAPGGPGPKAIQQVATGRVEFAMGACDDVILAITRGAPLLIVGAHMEHNPQAIMVHDDSPVKTFRDLNGKSVLCVAGSTWIDYVQSHYGITFHVLPSDFGLARFMADPNFIQQCFITSEPFYTALNGVKARTLLISDSGYDPYRVLFTNRTFAREHPEAVRAFVDCTARGWVDFLHGDATLARAKIQADHQQSLALMDYSIAMMNRYKLVEGDPAKGERAGLITPERMTALVKTLVDLKILETAPKLDDFVSFDFLPAAPKAAKT